MRRAIPALLALALSLTACQSTTQTASSPVTAASSATSPVTPAPTPSVAMTAGFKVSDVQEAEKVYREFYAALLGAQRKGGAASLPPALAKLLEPPASTYIAALLKSDFEDGTRLTSPHNGVLTLIPAEGHYRGDSLVAIRACADDQHLRFKRSDGATAKGHLTLNYAYFHRSATGRLVIFDTTTTRDSSPCSQ